MVPGCNDLRASRKCASQNSLVGLVGKYSQRFGWLDEFTHHGKTATRVSVSRTRTPSFREQELPGFGLRVYPSGAKVYVVQTRYAGSPKRVTVGRHGDVSPHQARKEAARIIARIKDGETPIPVAPKAALTMAELAERYQREHVEMRRRPATVAHYRTMLAKHIVPALGELKVDEICSV